jgi:hypothetical protein
MKGRKLLLGCGWQPRRRRAQAARPPYPTHRNEPWRADRAAGSRVRDSEPGHPRRHPTLRCARAPRRTRRPQALAAAVRDCAAVVRRMQRTIDDGLAHADALATRAEEQAEERAGALLRALADHGARADAAAARADARCDAAERLLARVAAAVGAAEEVSAGDDEEDRKRLKVRQIPTSRCFKDIVVSHQTVFNQKRL